MVTRRRILVFALVCTVLGAGYAYRWLARHPSVRLAALDALPKTPALESLLLTASFDEETPQAERVAVRLTPLVRGLARPTDLVFLPDGALLVLEQAGVVKRVGRDGIAQEWLTIDVVSGGELGLLGMALSPGFTRDGRLFVNYTRKGDKGPVSVVAEYRCPKPDEAPLASPRFVREILHLDQPYPNHNGGCLLFGPDGQLYIGFGDGGAANDPHGNGQDGRGWLGSILRIDVRRSSDEHPYEVPADNPFLGRSDVAPETFAIGVRNPWRMTMTADGRLIVADVGQNLYEELSVARAGDNLGWKIMEGASCFQAKQCSRQGLKLPFFTYEHPIGYSITGGHVVLDRQSVLAGLYVFGDFGTGRLWAIAPPAREQNDEEPRTPRSLGRWPLSPSTFGRDLVGRLYVADYARGVVYRIDNP